LLVLVSFANMEVDPLTDEFNSTFYRNVNSEDMLKDISKRYVYSKHTQDLVRYFEDMPR
jgi:hypothetical protein